MKQQRFIKSLGAAALAWATCLASAQYSFVNVADTTTPFPAPVGTIGTFYPPALSSGSVAFLARYGLTGQAIVTDSSGPMRIIAKSGDPGPVGNWTSFLSFVPVLSGSQVVFSASGSTGLGVFGDDGVTLATVAKTGDVGPVGTWAGFNFGAPPSVSDGTTAFVGGSALGGGVFAKNSGGFTTIASIGGPAPAGVFNIFGGVANSGSTVAFMAGYTAGAGLGIFTRSGGGLTTIAQRGFPGPIPGATFVSFSPPAISGGTVAFGVTGTVGQGIFKGNGGPLARIAWTGEVTPFGTFSSFAPGGVSISGSTVAFSAKYNSDADRGIFIWSGGALTKVIASGDPLFDSVATDVNMSFFALDPDGTVAFNYSLADGRSGVAIANPRAPNLPPVAVAAAGPDVDLDDGNPTVLVMSLNGVDAAVMLDGTASHDPDVPPDLPLSYDWFVDGSGSPIGSGDTFSTSLSVGLHTVALRVIDSRGLAGPLATVDVKVITRKDAITILEQKVIASPADSWRDADTQKHALNVKLATAVADFVSGDLAGGCARLSDFQNQLNAFVRSFRITTALAAELSGLAETIRMSIGCP